METLLVLLAHDVPSVGGRARYQPRELVLRGVSRWKGSNPSKPPGASFDIIAWIFCSHPSAPFPL